MARFHRARRWAAAGLLAAVGLAGPEQLQAQVGIPSPPMGSTPALPQFVQGTTPVPPIPTTTEPGLETILKASPAGLPAGSAYLSAPGDGSGARIIPPATPSANPPAAGCGEPAKPCAEPAPTDRFAKVPPVAVLPRTAWVPLPPTGPGFYTVFECLQGEEREKPPKYPYPRNSVIQNSMFDFDWRYLDDPKNTETDFWDFLKRQRFGPDDLFLFTGGGEFRARYTHEENSRLLNTGPARNRGRDNTYDLYRLRLYGDLYVTERFRIFGEFLSATSPDWLLPPLLIDRDPADFLNLFIDANLFDVCDTPVWLRVGRQELLYGSQRLVSPLDWANTRRTFQGIKAFWHSAKDDFDVFCVQPVIPNAHRFDSVDNNLVFAGAWYTHRPKPGSAIDAYYLMLDNASPASTGRFGVKGGYTVHTFGARWVGDKDNWLWDVEGMVQCGEFVNQGHLASAFSMGGGYYFKDCTASPTAWLYYDHASGTPDPGQGHLNQTFNQLFPFGHYYFGWLDLVGKRNINDVSSMVTFWPAKWMFTQFQLHNFWLDSPKDALYNPAGAPTRQDKTGNSGNYVGTELDLIVNFHVTNHSDILLAYGYMFAGQFIHNTATTPAGKTDPQAVYVQYTYRW